MKRDQLLASRECVWIRQQFGGKGVSHVSLADGFPLPVLQGPGLAEPHIPVALVSLLARGMAEIRASTDRTGRYFFTAWGEEALREAFARPNGLDETRCPALFASLHESPQER